MAGRDGLHSARRQSFDVSVVCIHHLHLRLRGCQNDSTVPEIITWKHSGSQVRSYIQWPLPSHEMVIHSYIYITQKLTPRHLISSQNIQIKYKYHLYFYQTLLKTQLQDENEEDIKNHKDREQEKTMEYWEIESRCMNGND